MNYRAVRANHRRGLQQEFLNGVARCAIEGALFDMDGTTYRGGTPQANRHREELDISAAQTLVEMVAEKGIELSYEDALVKSKETVVRDKVWYTMCDQYGLDRKEFHKRHMDNLDVSNIIPDPLLVTAIKNLEDVKLAVVTHGEFEMTKRILKGQLGLEAEFGDNIFDLIDSDFNAKDKNTVSVKQAMKALRVKPENTAMIDDTPGNMKPPSEIGMTSVFITNGKNVSNPYASYTYDYTYQFVEDLAAGKVHGKKNRREAMQDKKRNESNIRVTNLGRDFIKQFAVYPMMIHCGQELVKPVDNKSKVDLMPHKTPSR